MTFWQIAFLLVIGAATGFILSATLASRYYIGVGLAIILHAYMRAGEKLEMMDQLNILAEEVSEELKDQEGFNAILRSAKNTVRGAMFE